MTPEEIVQFAEDAHASCDVERIMKCFEDNIVASWNGRAIASSKAELRVWYHKFFDSQKSFKLKKTLRAAQGNMIAVEWQHERTAADGQRFEAWAAEIWWMSDANRLEQWHAHCTEYPLEE
ncbi:MAG: nuclear transport factor 2 family protein [Pseudomonadota bacterium]